MLKLATHFSRVGLLAFITLLLCACDGSEAPRSSLEVATKGAQAGAISDDGQYTIVGSVHHGASLWRNRDGERLYNWNHKQGDLSTIIASDFSPDGQWALTADPYSLVLWDMKNGQALRNWSAPGEVLSVALSADGNFALLGLSDHTAVVFDVKRGGIKRTFAHKNRVRSVDLSDDGRFALTGSEDYTAVLWELSSGQKVHEIQHQEEVQMVKLSPDGKLALSAAKYDRAMVWDTQTGKTIGDIPLHAEKLRRGLRFTSAKFSADGRQLITGRPDRIVQLWDSRKLKQLKVWRLPKRDAWKPTSAAVVAVGFGPASGHYSALGSNGFLVKLTR